MTKPEPSERLSERGAGLPGAGCPGPGWRGMKRRKNSSTSSSSMPGTCGREVGRRTACVVLMLTTALPWSSTSRVKSGSCACAASENAASHSAAMPLRVVMFLSWFLGSPILHRIGNALHAGGRCFAHDGHHVVRHFAGIDVDGAEARKPGPQRLALRSERIAEDRGGGRAGG